MKFSATCFLKSKVAARWLLLLLGLGCQAGPVVEAQEVPLIQAARRGDVEEVRRLLDTGVPASTATAVGFTALHAAVDHGHTSVVRLLLERGADPDAVTVVYDAMRREEPEAKPITTALYRAVSARNEELVEILLASGASTRGAYGGFALFQAVADGSATLVERLCRRGADPDVRNWDGETPLAHAAARGDLAMAERLLECHADVNRRSEDIHSGQRRGEKRRVPGTSPLFNAVAKGDEEMVRFLLLRGAVADVPGKGSKTPLLLAREKGQGSIARLLEKHGAAAAPAPELIGAIEALLRAMGYLHGEVDGIADDQTREGARRFYEGLGMAEEPVLDQAFLERALAAVAGATDASLVGSLPTAFRLDAEDHPRVAQAAAEALRAMGEPAALALVEALHTPGYERASIVNTLVKVGEPAVGALLSALDGPEARLVIGALGEIGDPRALAPLVVLLTNWSLSQEAASALRQMDWQPATDEEKIHQLVAEWRGDELRGAFTQARDVLLEDVASGDDAATRNALLAFIGIGNAEVLPLLVQMLETRGDARMADAYLNTGNPTLETAARQWAAAHGYVIAESNRTGAIQWGEM